MSDRRSSLNTSIDDPPNSRLFIVGSKNLSEDDFRNAFKEFGTIEEIWMVKDRQTGENKGVTYIKYSKTSEAAKALEAMNGKAIGNVNRTIKVMIAASRDQGSKRDLNEEEKMQRLFVVVPKNMSDNELYDYFKAFGNIDYATVIRDRETKESKGFGYVKYYKFSHAAAAFEQCDRKYKPVFAEPRKPRIDENRSQFQDRSFNSPAFDPPSFPRGVQPPPPPPLFNSPAPAVGNEEYTKLIVLGNPSVNQDQLWKLFDIVPGMDYCQLRYEGDSHKPVRFVGEVVYKSAQWANYACEKLHGFEYPPGYRLIVKPDLSDFRNGTTSGFNRPLDKPDILQIAETIAQASSLIQAAGISPDVLQAKLGLDTRPKDSFCSVKLPDPQPFAGEDAETVARCFVVCAPHPPPIKALRDAFNRFGNLIDVYMLNNRNCGYAKYASVESAQNAIQVLHGAEILGVRLKVLKAEERPDQQRKRQRLEENPY